ncbi:hypothetical protein [Mucilaginibacter sp.]|uniref:hypothetical protein n=1 Tax=Mucilaginibacter sp. TaxID=1882438 RepID=UPI00260865F5|nr:hypothetical protein [Mucilaginibacter sp.]MDB4919499.1 Transposase like protein [Mucilaginibacter sp.]
MSRNASTDELYFATLTVVDWISYFHQAVIDQKIGYIHKNPVRAGFVGAAHEYWYSSANPESPLKIIY